VAISNCCWVISFSNTSASKLYEKLINGWYYYANTQSR
jgi:hypothetical protein